MKTKESSYGDKKILICVLSSQVWVYLPNIHLELEITEGNCRTLSLGIDPVAQMSNSKPSF